jgi:hypothetical protein
LKQQPEIFGGTAVKLSPVEKEERVLKGTNGEAEILIAEWKSKQNRWLYGAETERKGHVKTLKAPTKVEVVGQLNPETEGEGKGRRRATHNKCIAAAVTKRKGK